MYRRREAPKKKRRVFKRILIVLFAVLFIASVSLNVLMYLSLQKHVKFENSLFWHIFDLEIHILENCNLES